MNIEPTHIKRVLLFAGVLIPELEENKNLVKEFSQNYLTIFSDIDNDSQKQLKLLVFVLSKLSLLYNLTSFSSLNYKQRQNYINKLFHFPISKLVGGLTGLRAICMVAFYNIESVMTKIHFDGPIK